MAQNKKNRKNQKISISEQNLRAGCHLISQHSLFGELDGYIHFRGKNHMGKETAAYVTSDGDIYANMDYLLEPKQWAYAIAHCLLHLAFGHFDAEKMPGMDILQEDGSVQRMPRIDKRVWNLACDLYVAKFLFDMKFGKPLSGSLTFPDDVKLQDEKKIYQYLMENGTSGELQEYGTAALRSMDMQGLEKPIIYDKKKKEKNEYAECFADALVYSVSDAVSRSGGHGPMEDHTESPAEEAMTWFVNHYPLLGSFASYFKVVEDWRLCQQEEISIAAIDVTCGDMDRETF